MALLSPKDMSLVIYLEFETQDVIFMLLMSSMVRFPTFLMSLIKYNVLQQTESSAICRHQYQDDNELTIF